MITIRVTHHHGNAYSVTHVNVPELNLSAVEQAYREGDPYYSAERWEKQGTAQHFPEVLAMLERGESANLLSWSTLEVLDFIRVDFPDESVSDYSTVRSYLTVTTNDEGTIHYASYHVDQLAGGYWWRTIPTNTARRRTDKVLDSLGMRRDGRGMTPWSNQWHRTWTAVSK